MAKADVKIKNGKMEAWVTAKAAKAFERHGWTVVDDGSSESETSKADEKPKPAKKSTSTTSRKAE
jgi:hypothetical protein